MLLHFFQSLNDFVLVADVPVKQSVPEKEHKEEKSVAIYNEVPRGPDGVVVPANPSPSLGSQSSLSVDSVTTNGRPTSQSVQG